MTTTMQAAQISKPRGEWELVERVVPEPRAGQVRVKVEACGMCHSDVFVKEGLWPGWRIHVCQGMKSPDTSMQLATTSQHGIKGSAWVWAGMVDIVSSADTVPARGLRHVRQSKGHWLRLRRRIRRIHDRTGRNPRGDSRRIAGRGSGSLYVCRRHSLQRATQFWARAPERSSPGTGIGGLGHLGVQYARQMGFETVAINRGNDKESLARQLGAHHYIDSIAQEAVTELQKLGGARVILATAPNAPAISALIDGLSPSGTLLVPAAPAEPLTISVLSLISGRRSVRWYAGTARDAQETLEFSVLSAVHPMIEQYPLGRVAEAYDQTHSGRVRFRVVLTVDA